MSNLNNNPGWSIVLRKYEPSGELIWEVEIPLNSNYSVAPDLVESSTGDLYIAYGDQDFKYVQKLDAHGNTLWQNTIDWQATNQEVIHLAIDEFDQVMVGAVNWVNPNTHNNKVVFRKFDASGNVLFNAIDDTQSFIRIYGLDYQGNGRFVFVGLNPFVNSDRIGYIDPGGVLGSYDNSWFPNYSPQFTTMTLFDIECSSNGDMVIYTNAAPNSGNASVIKLNNQAEYLWDQRFIGQYNRLFVLDFMDDGTVFAGAKINHERVFMKVSGGGVLDYGIHQGRIYANQNFNCNPVDVNDQIGLFDWHVLFIQGQDTFSSVTDAFGFYDIEADSGTFQIEVIPPNENLALCLPPVNIEYPLPTFDETVYYFQAIVLDECPEIYVNVGTPFIRRCFDNQYNIEVCNYGSALGEDVDVTVVLDPYFDLIDISVPPNASNGDSLFFELGDLDFGECVNLFITVNVSCDATLGQTHCLEAFVNEVDPCAQNPLPIWDGSSLSISNQCVGDSAVFVVRNEGSGDMANASSYTIVQNDWEYETGVLQLMSNEQVVFNLPADGSTWTLQVDQSEGHPGFSYPIAFVEECPGGFLSPGFPTMFPQDDGDSWIDIDCQENIGSYDPNDKMGLPKGFGPNHYIEPNTDLEYRIRFQNTGTDTAFNILIRDTLPVYLDAYSLVMGSSSHEYSYDIINGRVLVVRYDNIMLPDSNVNEPASNGYFKFRIKQKPDLPIGTRILNSAAIYFDFNQPIITNTTFHEVNEGFLFPVSIETVESTLPDIEVLIMPNPFQNQTHIEVLGDPD
ncbi:MAG: hypothetical protein AAF598_17130, partial [Bacteroidota bacterium]